MTEQSDAAIRKAGLEDALALLPLVEEFYAGPEYSTPAEALLSHLEKMLQDEKSAIFLAEDDGVPQGFVAATISTGLEFGIMAEVEDLFVLPGVRGKRIGSRLMVQVMEWCKGQGADEIFLVIAQQGEPARQLERLYLRLGFEPSRRRLMYRPLK